MRGADPAGGRSRIIRSLCGIPGQVEPVARFGHGPPHVPANVWQADRIRHSLVPASNSSESQDAARIAPLASASALFRPKTASEKEFSKLPLPRHGAA